jgi:hypothetical protein
MILICRKPREETTRGEIARMESGVVRDLCKAQRRLSAHKVVTQEVIMVLKLFPGPGKWRASLLRGLSV